jgi:hypothetical protein
LRKLGLLWPLWSFGTHPYGTGLQTSNLKFQILMFGLEAGYGMVEAETTKEKTGLS